MSYQQVSLTSGKEVFVRPQSWTEFHEQMKALFGLVKDSKKLEESERLRMLTLEEMNQHEQKLRSRLRDAEEFEMLSRNEALELSKKIDELGKAELERKN